MLRDSLSAPCRRNHKGNAFGALLTDLSKAFDCIDHTLLTAKLSAFGVSLLSLKLLYSYLLL